VERVSTIEDLDPEETAEWLDALEAVVAADGGVRAQDLLQRVIAGAARRGVAMTAGLSTPTSSSNGVSAPTSAGTRSR
jgi:pyruvate dehydrogenase E1 component